MDSNDKKIKAIMAETLKELVLPKLEKIEKSQEKHDKKLEMIIETVADVKVDIIVIQEDIADMGYTMERIETKVDTTARKQTDASIKTSQLARRVLRLETKKA